MFGHSLFQAMERFSILDWAIGFFEVGGRQYDYDKTLEVAVAAFGFHITASLSQWKCLRCYIFVFASDGPGCRLLYLSSCAPRRLGATICLKGKAGKTCACSWFREMHIY